MEDRVWAGDVSNVEETPESLSQPNGAYARVNGATVRLDPGASFRETCMKLSRDAGFGKFRVFLDGREIKPTEAPETIVEGMKMEIRAFDVAG